jgi:DNA repair protein RadC
MTYEIISTRKLRKTIIFKSPNDIFGLLKRYGNNKQEIFLVITLTGSHKVLNIHISTIGSANRTIVHPREVFRHAIADNASAIVVAHNHPSGGLTPSPEDEEITHRLLDSGKILGIHFLDHLIINKDNFYSFRQDNNIL